MDGVFYEANGKAYWNLSAAGGAYVDGGTGSGSGLSESGADTASCGGKFRQR